MKTEQGNTGFCDKKGYPINFGDRLTPLYHIGDYKEVKEYEVRFVNGVAMAGDRSLSELANNGLHVAGSVRAAPSVKDFHRVDAHGKPDGGQTWGQGFTIAWQAGPLGSPDDPSRKPPNGAFVEDIIEAAVKRLQFYQTTDFKCDENQEALSYLYKAQCTLAARTKKRTERKVEGTHQV